jgi:L-methionine (R)-S-oxide reductase
VPIIVDNTLSQIRSIAMGGDGRAEKGKRLAELIRKLGDYRWVGVYDVGAETASLIAWSGGGAPDHPSFPVSQGLTGAAIEKKRALIVGDVRNEPRYLSSFASTLSEIIVPVLSPAGGHVIGTVEVESDLLNAFSDRDQQMIERCAEAALPLWLLR